MDITTGIIILAAGSSSRLGQPKQLLPYNDTTLLKNTIRAASLLTNAITVVVLGCNHELIEKELNSSTLKISLNEEWQSGMSSSIVKGLKDLLLIFPHVENCIISVCDQPFINDTIFENLQREFYRTAKGIIASAYSGTLGIPILFGKKYFNELLALKGQQGAKKLLKKFSGDTASVSFEEGNIDIDTVDDYNRLTSKF